MRSKMSTSLPQQSSSCAERSTQDGLTVDISGDSTHCIIEMVHEKVEAFYRQHTEIKESHGIKHVVAVYEHAQKAIQVHKPTLSSMQSMKVLISALLHDLDDHKYFPHNINYENAREVMTCVGLNETSQSSIIELISFVSCSTNKNNLPKVVSENNAYWMLIPRWADRLEAVGCVGVIRCYQYNREIGAPMCSEQSPRPQSVEEVWEYARPERFEAYDGNSTDMISHYYDKLLHIARPPPSIVCNSYLETTALESSKELVDVCLRYGLTAKVDEDYIQSLKV